PDVPAHEELLAEVYAKIGQGYGLAGRLKDLEEARRQALAGYERLAQGFPTVPRYRAERFRAQWAVANLLWATGRRAEAEEAYRWVAALGDGLNLNSPKQQQLLALFLATCLGPQFRDVRRAVELATKVVERSSQDGASWNTLGIAQYRAGDWGAAIEALEKSMALSQGGDCGDWLFLAMAHWQRGEKDRARAWYDKATRLMDQQAAKHEEWQHFRAEAEELFGEKAAPEPRPQAHCPDRSLSLTAALSTGVFQP